MSDAVTSPPGVPGEAVHKRWADDPGRFFRNRATGRALRVAVVLPAVVGAFMWAGYPLAGFLAAFAVLTILLMGDFSGPRLERFTSAVWVTAAGSVTLALGALLTDRVWWQVAAALVLGVAVTLLAVMRGFLSKSTVPLLLPFFIAATEPYGDGPEMFLGWWVGGVVAAVASVVLWPFFPRRVISEAVADAIGAEADAVASFWGVGALTPEQARENVDRSLSRVHELFLGRLARPGSAYRRERSLMRLVEETRRMRLSLRLAYRRLPFAASRPDSDLAIITAQAMADSAHLLRTQGSDLEPFHAVQRGRGRHRQAVVEQFGALLADGQTAQAQSVGEASFQPRVVSLNALALTRDVAATHMRGPIPQPTFRGEDLPVVVQASKPWAQIRAELSWRAPWMRNALRLGVALAVALLVVNQLGLERGYWVVLGTLSVLRLDLSGTGRAAGEVILGQLVGFGLAVGLVLIAGDRPVLAWALLPVLAGLQGYLSGNGPVWLQQATFTALVVQLVTISAPETRVPLVRLEDVLIGIAVAVVVSFLIYPRGLVPKVEEALRQAVTASARYFEDTVLSLSHPDEKPPPVVPTVELARAAETIDLALVQGARQGDALAWWLRVWGSCEYIVYVGAVLQVVTRGEHPSSDVRRAAAAVAAAGRRAGETFEKYNLALISRSEALPARAADDDVVGVIGYSADVEHAQRVIDDAVAQAAQRRAGEAAEPLVELYWQLGWVGEVDLMSAYTRAVVTADLSALPA